MLFTSSILAAGMLSIAHALPITESSLLPRQAVSCPSTGNKLFMPVLRTINDDTTDAQTFHVKNQGRTGVQHRRTLLTKRVSEVCEYEDSVRTRAAEIRDRHLREPGVLSLATPPAEDVAVLNDLAWACEVRREFVHLVGGTVDVRKRSAKILSGACELCVSQKL